MVDTNLGLLEDSVKVETEKENLQMGISYYMCVNCGYTGPEGCFEKNTEGCPIEENYCDDCVDELFEPEKLYNWCLTADDNITHVKPNS